VSIFKFTYFDNVHLSLTLIAEIVLLYLTRPPPRCQFIAKETNVSHRILIDYFNFIREVLIFWAHNNSEQIGGEGKIVEIDEAKIGKRKYNRGRYLEEQWVFGGIERGSNIFFLLLWKIGRLTLWSGSSKIKLNRERRFTVTAGNRTKH
jgi:hypothetical protein